MVSLSEAATRPVRISYRTRPEIATGGSGAERDYVGTSGVLTIPRGSTSGVISVRVLGDERIEADEVFRVALTGARNATLPAYGSGGRFTRVTIQDDDGTTTPTTPTTTTTLSVAGFTTAEGNSGTTTGTFTVSLSAASTSTVTVNYATTEGTATTTEDYIATAGTLTFAPGVTSLTVPVTILGDASVEGNETFRLMLNSPTNATLATASAIGTIIEDDIPTGTATNPILTAVGFTSAEGNSGTTTAAFMVVLSPASTSTVTVNYATADGTATAGVDYVAAAGTLTFAPGTTMLEVPITIIGDVTVEATEALSLVLSDPTNAMLASASAIGTITEDDTSTDTATGNAVTHAVALQGYLGQIPFAGHSIADIEAATTNFLSTLTSTQLASAQGAVDATSWVSWVPTPGIRSEGLQTTTMNQAQLIAMHQMLESALSTTGYSRVTGSMLADDTLTDQGNLIFGSEYNWIKVYGNPTTDERWGFQLEAHHLVRNVIIDGDQLTITPSFLGIEPFSFPLTVDGTTTTQAPYQSILTNAYAVVQSLGSAAVVSSSSIDNLSETGGTFDPSTLPAEGVAGSAMTAEQQALLLTLINEYIGTMPDAFATVQLAEIQASLATTYFSWRGGTTNPGGEQVSLRISGPDIYIEGRFNMGNMSNDYDHLHSVVRDPKNDYGAAF